MSQELQKSPVERAKDALSITGEIKSFDLYAKLRDYRNNLHPDRFTDDEQKRNAEDKFKEIQALLVDLFSHIQQERLSIAPSDLAIHNPSYDNVYFQEKIDQTADRISELESKLEVAEERNSHLYQKLEAKSDDSLLAEMREIESIYKVSYGKLKPVGVVLLLTGVLAGMTKIEEVSVIIKKYAPIAQGNIDLALFGVFALMLLLVVKQALEHKAFAFSVNKHCSSMSTSAFMDFLCRRYKQDPEDVKTFSENDVFDYIAGEPVRWKRLLAWSGVRLFHTDTCDNLKKCFINNLLHKKLIQVAEAKNLDRLFKVVRPYSRRYRPDYD